MITARHRTKIQSKLTNIQPKLPISGQMLCVFHLFSERLKMVIKSWVGG